jgi:hypothetical protein
MPRIKMVPIRGSQKQPLPNAGAIGPAPQVGRLEVTVRLWPRTLLPKTSGMLNV